LQIIDLVPISQVAEDLQISVRHAQRLVQKRAAQLGIQPHYGKRNALSLSRHDADVLIASYQPKRGSAAGSGTSLVDRAGFGFFYIIQLHPEDMPDRIKIGFTDNVNVRLSDHRTTAPTLKLLKAWRCKRTWERAAMDSITREHSRPLGGEVYDGAAQGFVDRAEAFFAVMPRPSAEEK
jgi:hypothetical protein